MLDDIQDTKKIKYKLGTIQSIEINVRSVYCYPSFLSEHVMPKKLPLHISLDGRSIVIIGGGKVALRKVQSLLPTAALITVITPSPSPQLLKLAGENILQVNSKSYSATDIKQAFMVIAATNDSSVNKQITTDALQQGCIVINADNPEQGNCTFPALLRRGEVTVSVATNGKSPGYAAYLRDLIATIIIKKHGEILNNLAAEREKLLTNGNSKPYNRKVLHARIAKLLDESITHKEG